MKINVSSLRFSVLAPTLLLALAAGLSRADEVVPLSSLDVSKVQQDWGEPRVNRSVERHPLSIGGQRFTNGIGTHAYSQFVVDVNGDAQSFTAQVGVDDEVGAGKGNVRFEVDGDGHTLWQSGFLHAGDAPVTVNIPNLAGIKQLTFIADNGTNDVNYCHADWADALLTMRGGKPVAVAPPPEPEVILTPKPSPAPRINSAKIFGVRPGHPFLFTVAATGDRPMTFSARHLPRGLRLDSQTGRITGVLEKTNTFLVTLRAQNKLGAATQQFKIVCGPQIGLTPAMGWNSWNCFASAVTEDDIKAAADAMVRSGLINHGWTYINIDDYWEVHRDSQDPTLQGPQRDAQGRILPNPRFPDMKALTAYVHSKGLKIGLYSSPGPWTCGGCVASFDHELLDAQRYADWGFDYLKYDWCSYRPELEAQRKLSKDFVSTLTNWIDSFPENRRNYMRPYAIMRAALDRQPRDILYSLCQYGMGNVWEWGADVGGNSWRTTGDIRDTWSSMSGIGFSQNGHEKYAGPGHFNDPDMLVVGYVGWGPRLHPTRLTPNEQYTHISLWCLLAAPLLIGCDMTKLDDFTLSLLSNDEVLEVDQDPLGRQASRVSQDGLLEVWAKDMEDGSKAVGLFNRSHAAETVVAKFSDLGLSGKQRVRDLWRQHDLGEFTNEFSTAVPPHGVVLVRIWPVK